MLNNMQMKYLQASLPALEFVVYVEKSGQRIKDFLRSFYLLTWFSQTEVTISVSLEQFPPGSEGLIHV